MQLAYGYATTANSSWGFNMTKIIEKLNIIKKIINNFLKVH